MIYLGVNERSYYDGKRYDGAQSQNACTVASKQCDYYNNKE